MSKKNAAPVVLGEFKEGLTEQQVKEIIINKFRNTMDTRENKKVADEINSFNIKVAYMAIGPGEADSCIFLLLEKESKNYIVDAVSQSTCLGFTGQFLPREVIVDQIPTFPIKTAWFDKDRKKNKFKISVALHEAFGLEPPEEEVPPISGTEQIDIPAEMKLSINTFMDMESEVIITIPGGTGLKVELPAEIILKQNDESDIPSEVIVSHEAESKLDAEVEVQKGAVEPEPEPQP